MTKQSTDYLFTVETVLRALQRANTIDVIILLPMHVINVVSELIKNFSKSDSTYSTLPNDNIPSRLI